MSRIITLLSLSLAAAIFPQIATAQTAPKTANTSLDEGFYDVTAVVSGYEFLAGTFTEQICVRPGENDEPLKDLIFKSKPDDKMPCEHNNVIWTDSTVQADVLCRLLRTGEETPGSISAQFRSDFLQMSSIAQLTPQIEMKTNTTMTRKGECPAEAPAP